MANPPEQEAAPLGKGRKLKRQISLLSAPNEAAKDLWEHDKRSPSNAGGGADSGASGNGAGAPRRKMSLMPPRRPSAAMHGSADAQKDQLIQDHLAGAKDLLSDLAEATMVDSVLKETLSQVQKISVSFHG